MPRHQITFTPTSDLPIPVNTQKGEVPITQDSIVNDV